jgi:hypothetical protein
LLSWLAHWHCLRPFASSSIGKIEKAKSKLQGTITSVTAVKFDDHTNAFSAFYQDDSWFHL